MSEVVTILSSLVSGLLGGGLGFYLSNKKLESDAKKYLNLYWQELADIRDEEVILLQRLLYELDEPKRPYYTTNTQIDWGFFQLIQANIGSGMPFNMNRLLSRLKTIHEDIEFNMTKRLQDLGSSGYYSDEKGVLASSLAVCNLLYLVNKALEQRECFRMKGEVSREDVVNSIFLKYSLSYKHRDQLLAFISGIKAQ